MKSQPRFSGGSPIVLSARSVANLNRITANITQPTGAAPGGVRMGNAASQLIMHPAQSVPGIMIAADFTTTATTLRNLSDGCMSGPKRSRMIRGTIAIPEAFGMQRKGQAIRN